MCFGFQSPSAVELEQLALNARNSIRTLTATIHQVRSNSKKEASIGIKLWRDGNKGRADVVRSDGPRAGVRVVECRNCDGAGTGTEYVNSLGTASKLFKLREDSPPYLASAADWRVIGYYPNVWGVAQKMSLDSVVGASDRRSVRVDRRTLGSSQCWVLSYSSKRHGDIECWIDPARGHNVVRLRQSLPTDNNDFFLQADSEVRAVPGSTLWFPTEVRVTSGVRSKGTSQLIERTEFTDVRVNEAIPPATFTLAGFGVTEGTTFSGPNPGQGREWRDGKLGPLTNPVPAGDSSATPPVPVDPSTQRTVNPWLLAVCGLSAVAAVGVVLRSRRG